MRNNVGIQVKSFYSLETTLVTFSDRKINLYDLQRLLKKDAYFVKRITEPSFAVKSFMAEMSKKNFLHYMKNTVSN